VSPADLVWFPPICLVVVLVWAGTREDTPAAILRHALILGGKLAVGLLALGVVLSALLYVIG
jgi:hypothetical protein